MAHPHFFRRPNNTLPYNMMARAGVTFLFIAISMYFTGSVTAQNMASGKSSQLNLKNGIALSGYDAVAYFSSGKALKGSETISFKFGAATYYFSSVQNLDEFKKQPQKYLPQYGGWCAYAMGAKGEKVEVDPETFKIINGKLYLFYNKYFNNTLNTWNKDETNLKAKADLNWKKIIM